MRLFIGLALPPAAAEGIVAATHPLLAPAPGLVLYPARDLHLTLAFLGAFPGERRAALERALTTGLRGLAAPDLVLEGTGAFPHRRRPRVLWVGVGERGRPRLEALRGEVWRVARDQGWEPGRSDRQRPFRPHVTLARVRGGTGVPAPFHQVRFAAPWRPAAVTLFESRPGPVEERYPALLHLPLVVD